MKKNEYHIEQVEFYYNGDEDKASHTFAYGIICHCIGYDVGIHNVGYRCCGKDT